jgi:hypothetical protein
VFLDAVYRYDLLQLNADRKLKKEKSESFIECVNLLCSEVSFARLAKPPVNGVTVINLSNLVKNLVDGGVLALKNPKIDGLLLRLLRLVAAIPVATLVQDDGRVLSNSTNFLSLLILQKAGDEPGREAIHQALILACRRALTALNAENFARSGKTPQSLSNLVSFVVTCHAHRLPMLKEHAPLEELLGAAKTLCRCILAKRADAYDERITVDSLISGLDYLLEHGLREDTQALREHCAALQERHSSLYGRARVAPMPISPLDPAQLQLPASSLSSSQQQAKERTDPDATKGQNIPGDTAIISPPSWANEDARINATTTYTSVSRSDSEWQESRRTAKADSINIDNRSLAAQALLSQSTTTDGSALPRDEARNDDDEERTDRGPDPALSGKPGGGMAEAGNRRKKKQVQAASAPRASRPNAAPAPAVARDDGSAEVLAKYDNSDMKLLLRLLGYQNPSLIIRLLASADARELASGRAASAFDQFFAAFEERSQQLLSHHFTAHPPVSAEVSRLLTVHGIIAPPGRVNLGWLCDALLDAARLNQRMPEILDALKNLDDASLHEAVKLDGFLVMAVQILHRKEETTLLRRVLAASAGKTGFSEKDILLVRSLMRDGAKNNPIAKQLFKFCGPTLLGCPVTFMHYSNHEPVSLFSFPMYAIARENLELLERVLAYAPDVFGQRHAFGFSVLSVALLKDDMAALQLLLGRLRRDVVDALACAPDLPEWQKQFSRRGIATVPIPVDELNYFSLGYMPGFDAISQACGMDAIKCLKLLLSHSKGRIGQQRSAPEWQTILAWPDLKPEIRDIVEPFIVTQLCACALSNDLPRAAHWIASAPHLVTRPGEKEGRIALSLAIAGKHYEMAALLLDHDAPAQVAFLKKQTPGADWTSAYPGIDPRMASLVESRGQG